MPVQMSLLKLRQIQKVLVDGVGHNPESLSAGTSEQWSVCLLPLSPVARGGNWVYPSTVYDCEMSHINLRTSKSNQALLKLLTWNLSKVMVTIQFSFDSMSGRARPEDGMICHILSPFYNKQKWLSMSLLARLKTSFVKYCPMTNPPFSFSQKTLVELSPEVRCSRENKSNMESQGAHDRCINAQTSIAFPTSPQSFAKHKYTHTNSSTIGN